MHTTQYQVTSPINGQKTWTDIFQKIRWTYKKIFNIAECQRNANPNHRGMCAHTGQKGAPGPGWGPRSQSRGSFGAGASASPFESWSRKHVGCRPAAVTPWASRLAWSPCPGEPGPWMGQGAAGTGRPLAERAEQQDRRAVARKDAIERNEPRSEGQHASPRPTGEGPGQAAVTGGSLAALSRRRLRMVIQRRQSGSVLAVGRTEELGALCPDAQSLLDA